MNTFNLGDQVRVTEQAIKARKGIERYASLFPNITYTIKYSSGFDVYVLEEIDGYFNNDELILVKKFEMEKPVDKEVIKKPKRTNRNKHYNKKNCTSYVRAHIIDAYGRKITLCGTHAFDYSIYIESISGNITVETYKNGDLARKRLNELRKK